MRSWYVRALCHSWHEPYVKFLQAVCPQLYEVTFVIITAILLSKNCTVHCQQLCCSGSAVNPGPAQQDCDGLCWGIDATSMSLRRAVPGPGCHSLATFFRVWSCFPSPQYSTLRLKEMLLCFSHSFSLNLGFFLARIHLPALQLLRARKCLQLLSLQHK